MNKNVKTIAFYLPQFHTIPENDASYGEGFTEWSNTKKAIPLFEGHYQPRTPLEENYYCLLDDGVMEKQANMAKNYGIYGFCYYHYWFKNGKKLLEKPLELMLHNPKIDIPFCLCWANENWTKRWDGGNNEVIVEQDYGDLEDLNNHVDYLCQYFKDSRYIKDDGLPILLIYKPEIIPNLKAVVSSIRERVRYNGFRNVKLIVQYPKFYFDGANMNLFDAYVQFEPRFIQDYESNLQRSAIKKKLKSAMLNAGFSKLVSKVEKKLGEKNTRQSKVGLSVRDYDKDWQMILDYPVTDKRMIAGAFVDWDNTPRNKRGLCYTGATPEKFRNYMTQLVEKVNKEYENKYIFINAWNEWAEGAYLEPDEKNGYDYLKGLRRALDNK